MEIQCFRASHIPPYTSCGISVETIGKCNVAECLAFHLSMNFRISKISKILSSVFILKYMFSFPYSPASVGRAAFQVRGSTGDDYGQPARDAKLDRCSRCTPQGPDQGQPASRSAQTGANRGDRFDVGLYNSFDAMIRKPTKKISVNPACASCRMAIIPAESHFRERSFSKAMRSNVSEMPLIRY